MLPILSRQLKTGDNEEARRTQDKAVEYGILLSLPAAVMLVILAEPIINILFQHGKFGAHDTVMTANALIAYAVGLPLYVVVKALAPNFFARGDTKTPVKYSVVVLIANIVFALLLMKPFGHVGIAAATTLAAVISLWQYVRGLKKRAYWRFSPELVKKILLIALSSLLMGIIMLGIQTGINFGFGNWLAFPVLPKIAVLGLLGILGLASFLLFAKLTRVLDISEILKMLKRKRKNNAKVSV